MAATPPNNNQNAGGPTRPPPRLILIRPQPTTATTTTTTHGGGVKRPRFITDASAADPVVSVATSSRQRPPTPRPSSTLSLFDSENCHGQSLSSSESESESESEAEAVEGTAAISVFGLAALGGSIFFLKEDDVLDCPICTNPLTIPVFQCENGHIACTDCCPKLKYKCPSCSRPIGQNRNRAVEKIIESVQVPCCNWNYGCREMIAYNNKHEHNLCIHAPCSCPNSGCNFVGSLKNLGYHCMRHPSIPFRFDTSFYVRLHKDDMHVILVEAHEKNVFIVNHASIDLGGIVDVDCIAPVESKMKFPYTLSAVNAGTSLQFKSFAKNVSKWIKHVPQRQFLVVSCDWYGQAGELELVVCINKDDDVSVV